MKTKMIKTVLPTMLGILTVLGLLLLYNLIIYNGDVFHSPDNGFLTLFVPIATIIALTIQFTLSLPFWEKFKSRKRVWGLTLFQFTILICVISGLIFGLLFWESNFGFSELIFLSLTGMIAFAVYWTVNLLTLKKIDKLR
jgi:hypothetical protein